MKFSRQELASLMKPKQASKGWRKMKRPDANPAANHAMKRTMIHRRAKQGFPAMIVFQRNDMLMTDFLV